MKKFVSLLIVAVLMVVMATSAFAASYTYDAATGKVTGGHSADGNVEIYLDGELAGGNKLSATVTAVGKHTVKTYVDGELIDTWTFVVEPEETEAPATEEPTPTPTAEPTPTPVITAEPTPTPVITEAPKTEAPKTEAPKTEAPKTTAPTTDPTKAPSTDNDDVPKTGDATTTFVFVIVAAMLLAAGALTAMRVYARKK